MADGDSDFELLAAWKRGDTEAGKLLVERQFSTVFRFIRRRVRDADQCRELAQRTFLTCLESGSRVRGTRFQPFALGVARNIVLSQGRDDAGRNARASELGELQLDATSPSAAAAAREEQRALVKALRRLPPNLQVVIELYYWEDLTTREIGEVLDTPQGTVKWQLSEARSQLKVEIEQGNPEALAASTLQGFEDWARSVRRRVEAGPG